jgi:hypothetical protein
MAKGKKSVALFEVITAQRGRGVEQRIPRPGFWKRLGLGPKVKLDPLGKAQGPVSAPVPRDQQEEARQAERMRKAAVLKAAQERTAARAAKRAKAEARHADRQRERQQREAERLARAARTVAEKAKRGRAAEGVAASQSLPAAEPATRPRPTKADSVPELTVAGPTRGPLQLLRGMVRMENGRLLLKLDWLTGTLAAAALLLVCGTLVAVGAAMFAGGRDGRTDTAAAAVDPLLSQQPQPLAAGLPEGGQGEERIRPADDGQRPEFRFQAEPNYIVVVTTPSHEGAAGCQRFLKGNGIDTVVVPVNTSRGQEYEVVCTEGFEKVSDPRCMALAARIRELGKIYSAPPHRGGTDFAGRYAKKGVHYLPR